MNTLTDYRANGDAIQLIRKYLPEYSDTIEVASRGDVDKHTGAALVKTTINWRGEIENRHVQLGMAITELPGYLRATNDERSITYWRSAA